MERSTIVRVHDGLHARPATRFVKLAKSFESDIELVKDDRSVSAKSSVKLMLLGVKENEEITVRATGADAIEAIEALIGYLENPHAGLEDDGAVQPQKQDTGKPAARKPAQGLPADGALRGVAASEGAAIGAVYGFFPAEIKHENRPLAANAIADEVLRLKQAIATVQKRMDASLAETGLAESDRGIVAALKDIANDDELTGGAIAIVEGGIDAVSAVIGATSKIASDFATMDDPYLNARADDVNAVGRQICLALLGQEDVNLDTIAEGSILVAEDIGAWDLARAPLKRIAGVICGHGGATSHVAIIARAHGIPAVLGLGRAVLDLKHARTVALDGDSGEVFADPDAGITGRFQAAIAKAGAEKQALTAYRDVTPRRADGTVIDIAANIGSLEEIDAAKEAGAMGVGLFRTELLFMRHIHLPSEDLQAETYSSLARAFAPHAVIVRTLDIGGDKPIAGVDFPDEENPFLGWRGIRMCLDRPDIFKPQLRALLRAAVHGNIKVMLPMISDVGEVRATKTLIGECAAELAAAGTAFAHFDLGVMIETPAAVLIAPALAREVAFFSIGTNDLTQYIMAADRLNPTVAKLNDVTHPAVMAAIELTAKAGTDAGIMVGMCGEAAGRPDLIPAFIAMGLTELSMSPSSIQRAKKCVLEGSKAD
ncbi:phosphoenolpyruvate--protein phosphotransferase [Phyllobacterium myrsinacearum]|uniref:Phosphoenolpyruvate-protein phosphotransferase n=3 Tax=Pseudomonadota TaxID=1224 RepID=A0A2S9JX11_9HYPH|nr:phosphoenolpyruvate--protein phosphotransferase [Phyllobacterium myrsinacearum]PRD57869.1 phosphoenolpyruvate--protein phosphotransferase [Phyllobacterium myrsinacearum]PWV96036.1 phosphoenolpyruvate--protein phosphotransferase [Phyllobacterium myrsinacearum]RZV09973.1 phosphoenolpyruvate--protein phosphotransferase [Phyllobacterium myrsinacearum]